MVRIRLTVGELETSPIPPQVETRKEKAMTVNWTIRTLLLSLPMLWITFVLLYGSVKAFK